MKNRKSFGMNHAILHWKKIIALPGMASLPYAPIDAVSVSNFQQKLSHIPHKHEL